ncbi:MAG TPA: IclR family transcriptional regulator [Xanthobacteraceae bacterium]|nr:IclR family transcriptional regulator [Xanthobacteraceae bacterium]
MSNDKVEAVERALTVLNSFQADKPVMTLGEIAAATGFYKSTILRLTASLERLGYLVRDESGVFRLGPALVRLGSIYRAGFNLGEAVRPELRRLVTATGETASFYVREGQFRVCLFRHNSPHSARHHLDEGAALPMTAGASAHVLLAFSDANDASANPAGANTAGARSTSPKGAKGKTVQERGHYVSLGERDPHVASVAVPVFDLAGHFRGALAVSGLIGRFQERARQAALAELVESAQRLRTRLPASE